jgi:hypothetical protein
MSATAAAFRQRWEPQAPAEPHGKSPWLDSQEAADLVRCPTRRAFREWARRAGIVPVHRGTRVLYAKRDVDAALQRQDVGDLARLFVGRR